LRKYSKSDNPFTAHPFFNLSFSKQSPSCKGQKTRKGKDAKQSQVSTFCLPQLCPLFIPYSGHFVPFNPVSIEKPLRLTFEYE